MKRFEWQCIKFEDGSNPYVCTTEKSFNKMQRKYDLKEIKKGFWLAKNKTK